LGCCPECGTGRDANEHAVADKRGRFFCLGS
jgi:hypothetical protein